MTFRDSASRARIEATREDLETQDALIADQASLRAWGAQQRARRERLAAEAAVNSWGPAMKQFMPKEQPSMSAKAGGASAAASWDHAMADFMPPTEPASA